MASQSNESSARSFAGYLYEYVEIFVIAACIVLFSYSFVARLCAVSGDSMKNTLINGEMLVVTDIGFEPEYGDIIVFHETSSPTNGIGLDKLVVKRIIATEGQTVNIDFNTWTLTITDVDGTERPVDESAYRFLDPARPTITSDFADKENKMSVKVPEGKLFVMGDNRNNSMDSRDNRIGFVDERRVLGKAVFRLTPFSKFGLLPSVK